MWPLGMGEGVSPSFQGDQRAGLALSRAKQMVVGQLNAETKCSLSLNPLFPVHSSKSLNWHINLVDHNI